MATRLNYSDPFGLFECSRARPRDCSVKDALRNVLAVMPSVASPEGGQDTRPGLRTGQLLALVGFAVPGGAGARGATNCR
jgi:hypothetical protein